MTTLQQAFDALSTARDHLAAVGCREETIAEAIRLGGDLIPVFGSQLKGCYIRPDGRRESHFAVPGWYQIMSIDCRILTIVKPSSVQPHRFECDAQSLLAVLGANLECVAKGHCSP